ncbi:hypothetical protein GOV07_02550 [Candidatus Woesearchaeota archaeon]|nr:hypothetical protein [Candidatus Woesearchaeota archaeon]
MRRTLLHNLLLLCLLFGLLAVPLLAEPPGAEITYNLTVTPSVAGAGSHTTAGGSFTTLVLNATTQTPRWKAYVGNVTGTFTLRDANNASIYSWGDAFTGGEVYSSRAASPGWSTLVCGNAAVISSEENFLNMTVGSVDNISATFNESVHREFYAGTTQFAASTCPAIATYINSQPQGNGENADFQEVLLRDTGNNLIWTALIDPDTLGYDNTQFDFQMIVPEDQYSGTGNTYYFWLELS